MPDEDKPTVRLRHTRTGVVVTVDEELADKLEGYEPDDGSASSSGRRGRRERAATYPEEHRGR